MKLHPRSIPTLAAAAIMLLIFAAAALRYDHFAAPANLANLLTDYAYVMLAAAGAALVILMGGIDLSTGSVAAFAGVLLAALTTRGWHPLSATAAALAAGAALGASMGALIELFALPPFMITLAGMFAIRAAGFLFLEGSTPIDHPFLASLSAGPLTWPSLACLVAALLIWLIARRTPLGRNLHAIGGAERAARMMGVPIARTRITIYSLAALCSSAAGCALALDRRRADPTSSAGLELTTIAAVVIGGTLLSGGVGSIPGTLIGVAIIALIRMTIDFEGALSSAWTSLASGALLLAFILLQKLISTVTKSRAA
jgi:simple sugar transport system permease protein